MRLLFLLLLITIKSYGQIDTLQWEVFHPIEKKWLKTSSCGSVQELLISLGKLPDPFYGLNEEKFKWIEDHKWIFRTTFYLSEKQFLANRLELNFPCIDTYADVYLNDSLLFQANNFFRPYRSDIKGKTVCGYNEIQVVFTPPVQFHKERYANEKFHYPAPNDVHEVKIAPLTRKPQYQFGWDWALRMNTMGFQKPVTIEYFKENKIINHSIQVDSLNSQIALLTGMIYLNNAVGIDYSYRSDLFGELVPVHTKRNQVSFQMRLKEPKLWWPRGQGDQNLYTDRWGIYDGRGDLIDEISIQFGVKKVKLVQEKDQWGTSYFIELNGRPIFCKGANYIPQEVFPTQVEDSEVVRMIQAMVEANFNTVRVWGGGYYPDEIFYQTCDELGIMVWQDLMFACSMYPGDSSFLHNVKNELEFQIPRIAKHPSVVLFNGNNEVDVAWKNWGFQKQYGIHKEDSIVVGEAYDRLFKQLAPKVIGKSTNIPYVHTSPLSNWGKDEYFNHGTMHYWGVWHGKDPIEDFGLKTGRFNAEYGFQSFPEFKTLLTFSEKSDWQLESAVMKHHQKSYVGNKMIKKHADILYGETEDFERFIYYSQLTQAKAVGIAISGHRIDMPRCMGTIFWQLNDCWPAPTWSSIDYYGNWKALHYEARASFEDLTVLANTKVLGKETYYLVNDGRDVDSFGMHVQVLDLNGKEMISKSEKLVANHNSSKRIASFLNEAEWENKNYVVKFSWIGINGEKKNKSFVHVVADYKPAKDRHVEIEIIQSNEGNYVFQVEVKKFVQDLWITHPSADLHLESNFINLLPGTYIIHGYSKKRIVEDELFIYWR
jgi:beta-mannosidase